MPDKLTLKDALINLNNAIKEVNILYTNMDMNNIPMVLSFYDELSAYTDITERLYKEVNSLCQKLSYEEIPDMLDRHEVDSIKIRSKNFITSARINASIPFDKRQEGHRWLENNGLGALIIPTVNAKSLSSAIKDYIQTNAKMPPKDAMTVHLQRYTSVRKT